MGQAHHFCLSDNCNALTASHRDDSIVETAFEAMRTTARSLCRFAALLVAFNLIGLGLLLRAFPHHDAQNGAAQCDKSDAQAQLDSALKEINLLKQAKAGLISTFVWCSTCSSC